MYEGVNVTDAGTLAALRGVGFGGYGGGQIYNPIVQDGSAVKEAVTANRDISLAETINRSSADLAIGSRLTDAISSNLNASASIERQIAERATADRFASLERQMNQQAIDAQRDRADLAMSVKDVLCCCEANGVKIDNLAALNAKDLQLQTLQMQNQTLQTQLAVCLAGSNGNNFPPGQGNGQGN